jgi:hypothetical protein
MSGAERDVTNMKKAYDTVCDKTDRSENLLTVIASIAKRNAERKSCDMRHGVFLSVLMLFLATLKM